MTPSKVVKPANPKKAYGDKKPALAQFPLSAHIEAAMAFMDGNLKYGFRNWREDPVEALTYIEAAMRHLRLFEEGEDYARDTKVKNLGAVIACCAILIDAELYGTMIDNRNHNPKACDLLHEREALVTALQEMDKERKRVVNAPDSRFNVRNPCNKINAVL